MTSSKIQSYLQSDSCPSERPLLDDMSPETSELHRSIDAQIKKSGQPYLHPDGETLQVDLLGSPRVVAWQEQKAMMVLTGESCWSDLPQIYARYGTESTRLLLHRVLEWEKARAAVLTDCGMQACALLFDVLVKPGGHAVIMRQVYNKTKKYLERICELQGSEFSTVDDGDLPALRDAIRDDTCMIFAETFTNPLMRAADPAALGAIAVEARKGGARGLRLVIDATIATPWSMKSPLLSHDGIDFVVASGTKALGGEDRDLWGYIASNRIDPLNEIMDLQAMRGGILDWRRARGILEISGRATERFRRRCRAASLVAAFLSNHPGVEVVHHPSLPDHPDRVAIDEHYQLPGSLLSFRLAGEDEDGARHFSDVLATTILPRYALSFDGLATKLNHHRSVSEYFTPLPELERANIDRLIRLGIGLEEPDDLIACLNWALWNYQAISPEATEEWRRKRAAELGIYGEPEES